MAEDLIIIHVYTPSAPPSIRGQGDYYQVVSDRSNVEAVILSAMGNKLRDQVVEVLECQVKHVIRPDVKVYW